MKQPSERCKIFLQKGHALRARNILDDRDAPPDLNKCTSCGCDPKARHKHATLFRCVDCHIAPPRCVACIITAHLERPFDRIQEWDRSKMFWRKCTLTDLGYELRLGHQGRRCKNAFSLPRDLNVIHDHGIFDIHVVYCQCSTAGKIPDQLIEAGLWPASWTNPQSATTTSALRTFHSLSMNAQVNANDYIAHLKRSTDNVGAADLKVSPRMLRAMTHLIAKPHQDRYREFGICVRQYSFVRACRWGGVDPADELPPASLVVLCPACPQPDHNMRPGWETRDPKYE